jgi:dipeptidyl aminopeptidase/acylaminoacyl peptidase
MFTNFYRTCTLLGMVCVVASLASAQDAKPTLPTNDQMRQFKAMGDPRLSPDGKTVLLRVSDSTVDGAKTHLWLVPVDGGAARQITYSPESDKRGERSGQWMPDGQSVVFLAKRGEHTTLYRLPMNGGEAKAFELKVPIVVDESKLPGALPPAKDEAAKDEKKGEKVVPVGDEAAIDPVNFRIAPDGKTIAIMANDPATPGEKKQKDAKADAEWVDHSLHRSRLYLMDVAAGKLTMAGVPVDVHGAAWSEDSTKLVVDAAEPNGVDELGPADSLWVVVAADAAHPVKVDGVPATAGNAVWTKDGKGLVYLAQAKQDTPPGYEDVYVYSMETKAVRNLTDGFGGSVGRAEPIVLTGGGLIEPAEQGVEVGLMRFAADGKADAIKLPVAVVNAVDTNATQNGWVFAGSSGGRPMELLYAAKLGDAPKVLSTPELGPKGLRSVAPQRVSWKSEGLTVEGLLYLPEGSSKVPLVVEVHGGPLGSYTDSYQPSVDYFVGQGWAVLRTNPRGSTGRGAAFAAANKNDLGGGDYRDIMAGVDYVLKEHAERLDPTRTALMGYSYGGEMAGFVETKTTRFRAIVSMAPVIDQNSEYGTENGSWYDQWYFGKPWLHEADAWRQSPLSGVAQAKTPFLLLQGQEDTTDPLGQSLEMYHALRQMGVPVELVTYPRVDHGPLGGAIYGSPSPEPWHGFDARRRIVEFIRKGFGETE